MVSLARGPRYGGRDARALSRWISLCPSQSRVPGKHSEDAGLRLSDAYYERKILM